MNELQNANLAPHVFSTKKLTDAQLQRFNANIRVASEDFIKIGFNRISPIILKQKHRNVIFTSRNAVESLLTNCAPQELQFENIYCVGRKTKRFIQRKIGPVTHHENTAEALAHYLVEYLEGTEVTYFRGDMSLNAIPNILEQHHITVNSIEAYKTKLSGQQIMDGVKTVLFFSPSGVESFLKNNKADAIAYCIGETTASEARNHFKEVRVAKLPDVNSLIDLINKEFPKAN